MHKFELSTLTLMLISVVSCLPAATCYTVQSCCKHRKIIAQNLLSTLPTRKTTQLQDIYGYPGPPSPNPLATRCLPDQIDLTAPLGSLPQQENILSQNPLLQLLPSILIPPSPPSSIYLLTKLLYYPYPLLNTLSLDLITLIQMY